MHLWEHVLHDDGDLNQVEYLPDYRGSLHDLGDGRHFHLPAPEYQGPFYIVTAGRAVGVFSNWQVIITSHWFLLSQLSGLWLLPWSMAYLATFTA